MKIGNLYATRNIDLSMLENDQFRNDVNIAIGKFINNDWGDICTEDSTENDLALETDERILAVYLTCKGPIWIISEFDRKTTTVLFPSDY